MIVGNLIEIYLSAKENVVIKMPDSEDYLYDGLAKDVPSGFFKWGIKKVNLDSEKLIIVVRGSNNLKEDYNEELKIFDLKACTWLDNTIRYVVHYKDDSDESVGMKVPQTLRALEKELWNESLLDKLVVKDDYIMIMINDTRENAMNKLNKR